MQKLLEALVKKNLISEKDAKKVEQDAKAADKPVDEIVRRRDLVEEKTLYAVKGEVLGFPLGEVPSEVPPSTLSKIPEETARYYKMAPLGEDEEGVLEVGMVYPDDIKAQEALRFLAQREGFSFREHLITPSDFEKIAKRYRTLTIEIEEAVTEFEKEVQRELAKQRGRESKSLLEEITEEAPVSRIVAVLIGHGVEEGASDIHVEPREDGLRVRFRFNGLLYSSIALPLKIHPAIVARIKILSGLRLDETRIPQDGKIHMEINNKKVDIRVSVLPTTNGEKVALRILDPTIGLRKFEELGLEARNLKAAQQALEKPYGLILAVGPTGSGKTTTLYAMINILDKERYNVITLEDPVEYIIEGVNQSQIHPDIGYTFATGLRHILRQDPDVIMVGEIRDKETANLAVHASLTGHLMFSTMHTNDAFGVVPRLVNLGIDTFLIPPSLSLVVAQRLVPRLCEFCKKEEQKTPKILKILKENLDALSPEVFEEYGTSPDAPVYSSPGCKKCMYLKSSGRIGIFEVLEMTKELSNIILKEESEEAVRDEARRQGFVTMRQDGLLKALRGVVAVESVLRVTE